MGEKLRMHMQKDLTHLSNMPWSIRQVQKVRDVDGKLVKYRFTWDNRGVETKWDFHRHMIERRSCRKGIKEKVAECLGEDIVEPQVLRFNDGMAETKYSALVECWKTHVDCCVMPLVQNAGYPSHLVKVVPSEPGDDFHVNLILLFDEFLSMPEYNRIVRKLHAVRSETAHGFSWAYFSPTGNARTMNSGSCRQAAKEMLREKSARSVRYI